MQFKTSVVKYSERDYTFKPFWAPFGPMAGPCRPTGSGSHGSCALQLLSFQGVPVPSPELSPTADRFSPLFLLSHFLIVPLDVHMWCVRYPLAFSDNCEERAVNGGVS